MNKAMFEAAKNYDIETIKKYALNGHENINQINEEGHSLFYEWLVAYYDKNGYAPDGYRFYESDKEYYEAGYPLFDWEYTPLDERNDNIKNDLDWFVSAGVDFNLAIRNIKEDYELMLPIYQAVICLDYPMMVYLMEHGAIPYTYMPIYTDSCSVTNTLIDWLSDELVYEHPSPKAEEHIKKMMKYLEEHGAY